MGQDGLGGGIEQDRRFKGGRMATADVTMPPFAGTQAPGPPVVAERAWLAAAKKLTKGDVGSRTPEPFQTKHKRLEEPPRLKEAWGTSETSQVRDAWGTSEPVR